MLKATPSPKRRDLLVCRAWHLRRGASEPERRLWAALSTGKLGVSFRRQVVLGNAIADFFAPSLGLVVEVDGAQHCLRRAADACRDRNLNRLGYHVLRIKAAVVMRNPPLAVALVREAVRRLRD